MAKKMMDGMMGEMEKEESTEPMSHEIKEAAECLLQAEEIKKNKALYTKAMEHLHGKKSAIESIADIRTKANEMSEEATPELKKKDK